jgi:hypothetical protein
VVDDDEYGWYFCRWRQTTPDPGHDCERSDPPGWRQCEDHGPPVPPWRSPRPARLLAVVGVTYALALAGVYRACTGRPWTGAALGALAVLWLARCAVAERLAAEREERRDVD